MIKEDEWEAPGTFTHSIKGEMSEWVHSSCGTGAAKAILVTLGQGFITKRRRGVCISFGETPVMTCHSFVDVVRPSLFCTEFTYL